MQVIERYFGQVALLEPKVFRDARGWFCETYAGETFQALGIDAVFVQDNQSYTAYRHTLRGIHFQNNPAAQSKLVRCTRGAILDVAVDLRKGSPTYKQWVGAELTADNKRQLWIPRGFGHGFITLIADVEVQYKVDFYYAPAFDRGIRFDDPDLGIDWGTDQPVLSDKDRQAPLLRDSDCNFIYQEGGAQA